ncbi:MAG: hypothetical protein RBT63_00980, partial [Bdellovibrionales bacterium]|nr:hypothetical protein [Bdellovibrionales bacterium]
MESRLESLNATGLMTINNDDPFTTSEVVTLSLVHGTAEQMYVTNDPTCSSGGVWETTATTKLWTLGAKNAETSVYVKFSNDGDGGLASRCVGDSIVHDDIAPTLSIINRPGAYTNAANVNATFSTHDSGSGVSIVNCTAVSGSTTASCSKDGITVNAPQEGSHRYNIVARDAAGTASTVEVLSFIVDRTAPTVRINSSPSAISNESAARFLVSGTEASGIERYEYRLGS